MSLGTSKRLRISEEHTFGLPVARKTKNVTEHGVLRWGRDGNLDKHIIVETLRVKNSFVTVTLRCDSCLCLCESPRINRNQTVKGEGGFWDPPRSEKVE